MAEESGKGIALVILGIVAIIAIVGLVLLFTGAKKATGEFAVPAAKEYGGAIRGVYDPYSRAFSGRAYEFPSQVVEGYSGLGGENVYKLTNTPGGVYGETQTIKGEDNQKFMTYGRDYSSIPSIVAATWLGELSGMPNLNQPADVNEARTYMDQGRFCKAISTFNAVDLAVAAEEYGLTRNNVQQFISSAQADGAAYICESPALGGLV